MNFFRSRNNALSKPNEGGSLGDDGGGEGSGLKDDSTSATELDDSSLLSMTASSDRSNGGRSAWSLRTAVTSNNKLAQNVASGGDDQHQQQPGRNNWFLRLRKAGHSAKVQSHIASLRAQVTRLDREIKTYQEDFGEEAYTIMERNRSMGNPTGGETDPEIVDLFDICAREMDVLLEIRKRKLTDFARAKGENTSRPDNNDKKEDKSQQQKKDESSTEMSSITWYRNKPGGSEIESSLQPTPSQPPKSIFQRQWLHATTKAVLEYTNKSELQTDIKYIDIEIYNRKRQFGRDLYNIISKLGDEWRPRDEMLHEAYVKSQIKIQIPQKKREKANKEIKDLDGTGFINVTHEDIKQYVLTKPTMWAMLGVNTGISEEECQQVAIRVTIELTCQKQGKEAREAVLNKRQFASFIKNYVDNPKGAQEFFHRLVFASFDSDENGTLDKTEIDHFLNTFYKSGSIFHGDSRLPEKERLKEMIWLQLDSSENTTGQFSFDEVRSLISGSTDCSRRISTIRPSWSASINDMLTGAWTAKHQAELEELYEEDEDEEEEEEEE